MSPWWPSSSQRSRCCSSCVRSNSATPRASKPSSRARFSNWMRMAARARGAKLVGPAMAGQYNEPMALPIAVYSAAQVRALDQRAIESLPVSGYTLMKRAGEAALRYLRARWPMSARIVIVCGGGNNGGDGYVLARFAQAAGLTVSALAATPPEQLQGDVRHAYQDFAASGGAVRPFSPEHLKSGEVIVDALLGTGLAGGVRAEFAEVIRAVNAAQLPVFALDVPSGLDGDSGAVNG